MIRAETAFMLCVLAAAVFSVAGYLVGKADGYQDGYMSRPPMPPATICKMKMPSSKYKQLDCTRFAWRDS